MLPYVEQQSIYNLYDMSRNTDDQRMTSDPNSERLLGLVIPTFICPSDTVRRRGTAPNFIMPASYHTNMGPNFQITNNGNCSCPLFQTFRTFSRANTGDTNPPGPFTRRGWQYQSKMADCLDGLSNTIFIGEVRAECSGHINGGWSISNRWRIHANPYQLRLVPHFGCGDVRGQRSLLCRLLLEHGGRLQVLASRRLPVCLRRRFGPVPPTEHRHEDCITFLGDKADKKAATIP